LDLIEKLHKEILPSPALSYVIGGFLSDGSRYSNPSKPHWRYEISLKAKDKEFVEEWNKQVCRVLGRTSLYKIQNPCRSDPRYRITVVRRDLYELLTQPIDFLLELTSKYPRAFIRGFGDGDGGVTRSRPQVKIWNSNLKLLKFIQRLLLFLGIHGFIHFGHKSPNGVVYQLQIQRLEDVRKYRDLIGFTIRRKQKVLEKWN
jgi:intein-encoded DNA endonuclease-like protein